MKTLTFLCVFLALASLVSSAPNSPSPHKLGSPSNSDNTNKVAIGHSSRSISSSDIPQLGNISTRGFVGTGNDVLIGGFIIKGVAPKQVLVRAIGPSLSNSGISSPLQDPFLSLHHTSSEIASNDDWQAASNSADIPSNLQPTDFRESAILTTLSPGAYTTIVSGVNGATGVGLVEVYDLDPPSSSLPTSQLFNISTRGNAQTGENVMIEGFVVKGSSPKTVLLRGIGPSLSSFGISGALQDPLLKLFDSTGANIATNDNWQTTNIGGIITSDQSSLFPRSLLPTSAFESAIIATLLPGSYTAIESGQNATTGAALPELYDLDFVPPFSPPYFSASQSVSTPFGGPFTISFPDGTTTSEGTNQLLVYMDFAASLSDMQSIAAAISNANASVVGQIPSIHELQVQLNDISRLPSLLNALLSLPSVLDAVPNLVSSIQQCSGTGVSGTAWTSADDLAAAAPASNGVILAVVDCFGQNMPGLTMSHGAVVQTFLTDSSSFTPVVLHQANGSDFCSSSSHDVLTAVADFVQANPGKKIVINASIGGSQTAPYNVETAWYRHFNFLSRALALQFGDNVILVKSAGNEQFNNPSFPLIPSDPKLTGCNFVTVGALDDSSPSSATRAFFSVNGPGITTFAPGCGVNPVSQFSSEPPYLGTSFAAPQVAGQLATIWARFPSLSACQVATQVRSLPLVNGFRRFDGQQLQALVANQVPSWSGNWIGTNTGTFTGGSCSLSGTANLNFTFSVSGSAVTGTGSANGYPCFNSDCSVSDYPPVLGNITGSVSGNTISLQFSGTAQGGLCDGQSAGVSFSGTIDSTGKTITGSNSKGTVVLHKQ